MLSNMDHHLGWLVVTSAMIFVTTQGESEDHVNSFHQYNTDQQHVCSIYIYTDPFLWRQVYKMEGKL